MRIGTWNAEYASPGRLGAQHEVLQANRADIWILTETRDVLSPAGCRYSAHSDERPGEGINREVKSDSKWVSVWSHFPLKPIFKERADPARTVVALADLGDGAELLVYGTVLPWHTDSGTSGQEKNWQEHYRVIAEQSREWRELREQYPAVPMCVAGDYNTHLVGDRRLPGWRYGEGGRRYGTIAGDMALEQGLAQCELFCATSPALLQPDLLVPPPIDHIALPMVWRERSRVTAVWPAGKGLSDHSGLVVSVDR